MKSITKIKILKEKNKQLLHSFNFSIVVNPDQEEDKLELDKIIKSFQEWLKIISVPRVNYNSSGINPQTFMENLNASNNDSTKNSTTPPATNNGSNQNLSDQSEYLPDPENINYKLLKPNFFIFF
jgi:hypothetical protein